MNQLLKFLSVVVLTLITSCATKVPMDSSFYKQDKKIGVLYMVNDSATLIKAGSQGLLDMAISSGRKYKEPLKEIRPSIYPKANVVNAINSELIKLNKSYIVLPEDDEKWETLPTIKKKKGYFSSDVTSLKDEYNIDQLMIVGVNYGLEISYYSMIETGKSGYNDIVIEVVDVNDNKLLFRDSFKGIEPIKGKWKENNYELLKNAIIEANKQSIEKLKGTL